MNFQAILALIGFALVAKTLRWQVGFCTLDSIMIGKHNDLMFITGVVLIAQNFLF
jgi:hypothetical protein